MVCRAKLETKGFAEYLEVLAAAGENIAAITDQALAAGGAVLVDGMVRRVPKDTHNLESHIGCTAPVQDGNYHYIEVGVLDADADTARYGNVQEYGASDQPAQSYIRPTLDNDMRKARAAMRAVFEASGTL